MNPRQCLRLYNRLTARFCDGARVFPRRLTSSALAQSADFLRWSQAEGIDPERLIRARHDATGWRFRIPLARLHLVAPGFLDKFREWGDDRQASVQID